MPITSADKQKLDSIWAEYGKTYGGVKEDYFALLYLTKRFKAEIREIAHHVAFGGNDYGIDAYHIDSDSRNLYLYQFKWSEQHALFKDSMTRIAEHGLSRLFGNSLQDAEQNPLLHYLKKDLAEHRHVIERVYVHFIFKGETDDAEKSDGLSNRREDIEAKAHLISTYFNGREVELEVDFIADKPGKKGAPPSQSYEIALRDFITTKHDGRTMYLGFVPLSDLFGIYSALHQQFFDRNIRGALSRDNAPNKKIREALDRIVIKADEEPSVFAFRHNGVTIAAERVTVLDGRARLHVPRVLNGAQTISSLARFLEEKNDNPLLKKNRGRLDAVTVIAKIIEDDPSGNFITQVTISNNQQNPVPPWALRAMDTRQVDLADKFREELGIFYSRQEGSFDNLTDDEKEEMGIAESKDMRIRPLAQTFLAVQGDVYNMGQLTDVFESQKLYEGTFKSSYSSNVDARSIVLAYKVGLMIARVVLTIRDKVPEKYLAAIPRARNLIWALLLQALLNDKKFEQYREHFGESMSKETAFGEVLKTLGGARVWPILKDLLASQTYQTKVAQQKFDFLRTSDAFRKAMTIANEKYEWTKRGL